MKLNTIPSYKAIFAIALPLMLGGISESISAVVDTAFMGQLGQHEMDSVGFSSVILLLIFMIGWGSARAVQVMISQHYGAKNNLKIGDVLIQGIYFIIPVSIFLAVLLYLFSSVFLQWIISNPTIFEMSVRVFKIRALGIPFLLLGMVISSLFIGIGNTRIILISQFAAALSNIILNYTLVFGKLGMTEMGFEGSATATVLSEIIGLFILIIYLVINSNFNQTYSIFKIRKIDFQSIFEIIKLAYPIWIQHIVSLGSWVYFFALIERMGTEALAISIILKQLFSIMAIPGFCLANTSNTLVGQLVGARAIDLIPKTIHKIARLSSVLLISFSLMVYLFRNQIFDIFTKDTYLIQDTYYPLLMLLASFILLPYANVSFNSILGMGNSKTTLIIESITIAIYYLYMYITIILLQGSLTLAWTSEIFYWFVLLIISWGYFYLFDWKKRIKYY
jgi:MATE family multidrug resistance protein